MMEQLGFDAPEVVCRSCRRSDGHAHSCGLRRADREALELQRQRAAEMAAEGEAWRAAEAARREERISSVQAAPPEISEGRLLGLAGMAKATAAEEPDWLARMDAAIAALAAGGEEFTAEDARRIAGDPEHPNAMGGRFNAAVRRGLIFCVGFRPAERPSLHGHNLRVWKGKR